MSSLCNLLGIEAPILQAPIGSASCPALVAAVSEAGGLGMLAGTWRSADALRIAIAGIRTHTSKPFAVNLGVHAAPEEKIDLCLRENVPVISLFWGDARIHFERIKLRGAKVIATVGTPTEAAAAEDAGADAVIAQGFEAGGHVWGKISSLALLPEVHESLKRIPFVAAGGIGDGRTMAAAMLLGASAVCLGTRFVLSSESFAHPTYQACLIRARAEDTYYGDVFHIGWPHAPHRVLLNSTVQSVLQTNQTKTAEVIAYTEDGIPIERYSSRLPTRGMTGQIEAMALYAGQSVRFCQQVMPAREIVSELMEESRSVLPDAS